MIKRTKKEPSKNAKLFWLVVRRTLITLLVILLFLVGSVYALGLTLANGPSPSLRDMLVLSAKQASATKWLPGLFLDDETIEQIMANSEKVTVTEIDINDFKPKPPQGSDVSDGEEYDEWADYPEGVRLEFLQGSTYRAYLTVVKDPSRLFVGVCDNVGTAPQGMTIFQIAKKYDAHVVIKAGEFPDNGSSP
ncbi:MAG: hypothetical protein J6V56_07630 [Clostridia bacterium]|nr:hypothetical protein [Clostridia bacterium]